MSATKTPTSSLTAIELLFNKLWYRTKAKIKSFFYGDTLEASTACPSPTAPLPHEIVEMIFSYLIYDKSTLLACSMTCYSWYIAAVPHLHHTLTTADDEYYRLPSGWKYSWPGPLRKSYRLGLLPLVRRFRIRAVGYGDGIKFTPRWLGWCTMRYFSALTNLQDLGIDYLQVSRFMPKIQRCFGHLAPTLRFLALKEPSGSSRQILYFIGLFPHLQDLKFSYEQIEDEQESTADASLVPLFIPPLRGRLILTCFTRENLVKDMILLFGGLRFQCMELFRVNCAPLLLDTCADSLETLRLYPTDVYPSSLALPQHFNLSRNKSLRTLETTVESIDAADDTASDFLKTVLSSITSPAPLDIVIIYQDFASDDLPVIPWCDPEHLCSYQKAIIRRAALTHQRLFKVLREIHGARDFRLVLCADVSDDMVEDAIKTLGRVVRMEKAKEGPDHFPYDPLIISERRTIRTRPDDHNAGKSKKWYIHACAL